MKHVFLYIRVSTEEQALHGLSIESQTKVLTEWAKKEGHHIAGTYVDAGISARKPASKRPALQQLLDDVRAGKGELIAFTKLDRWFRNISEYYKVQEILEKYNVNWKTIQEDYDTSNAAGRLKINIMLSVAQDEADRTGERIKAVFEMKRQKLEPLTGTTPTGYKIEGKKLVKDPQTEQAVNAFFQKYLACGSVSVAQQAALENGMRIEYQLASKMLDSAAYYGHYYDIDGMTPPYISKEEFDRIQAMRRRTVRKTIKNRVYLFSGIAVCGECGYHLGGKTNRKDQIPIYNCPGHYVKRSGCMNKTNISERKIEHFILKSLEEKVQQIKIDYMVNAKKQKNKSYHAEIASLRSKQRKLKELYLNDLISLDEYREDKQNIERRISELESLQRPVKEIDFATIESLMQPGWEETYSALLKEDKREFWLMLVREIRIFPDRHMEYDLRL